MADTDLSGSVIDGRYKVIEPIAEGAMGSVYRAERVGLGRAVAIKVMHQELPDELASRQRFEREAKLMALLEHPNCVSVNDFGLHDDKPFLVMDLVRGTSLLDLLDKVRQLEVGRAADIIRQVLSGLAHAHELGIVHRDIKPANIMISEKAGLGEQVRILDFGLARLTEGSTKLTTGIVVGTPNYMAPEQCKGSDIDARTDVYACGVMLFEMLTGRKPFVADDPIAVVRKHMLEAPPTMHAVEPRIDFGELEAVVAKALAKAPADRFESAVVMSKAVEVAAAKQTKTSAAALFARAVPENPNAPLNSPQATMSGWNVPAGAQSTAIPTGAVIPGVTHASPGSGPVGGIAHVGGDASAPFTGAAKVDAASGASGPSTSGFGGAGGEQPASSLPPLPQAGPYVPPAGIGAPSSPHGFAHGADSATPTGSGGVPAPGSGGVAAATSGSGGASAAPNAPLEVPPTRPTPLPMSMTPASAARPIPQLPFTKKQLMIGAGGLLGLIILIAVVAGGGDKPAAKKVTSGSGSGSAIVKDPPPPVDPLPATIEKAKTLIASEDYEGAVGLLKTARKAHPEDAELAFLAGKAYFGQLWWADGVDSFRDAVKLDASYKENPELLKTVLKGFLTTPDVDSRIVDFMRHEIGLPLRPYLEETAEKHPKKNLRARARAELNAGR